MKFLTLALKEYKKPKIKPVDTSKFSTPETTTTITESSRDVQDKDTNSGKLYTVKEGDSLWSISKKTYGDGSHVQAIVYKNSATIHDPNFIRVGQTIALA